MTLSITAFSIMRLCIMTFSITIFSITTLSITTLFIMTLSITTLSITIKNTTVDVKYLIAEWHFSNCLCLGHCAVCHYAECRGTHEDSLLLKYDAIFFNPATAYLTDGFFLFIKADGPKPSKVRRRNRRNLTAATTIKAIPPTAPTKTPTTPTKLSRRTPSTLTSTGRLTKTPTKTPTAKLSTTSRRTSMPQPKMPTQPQKTSTAGTKMADKKGRILHFDEKSLSAIQQNEPKQKIKSEECPVREPTHVDQSVRQKTRVVDQKCRRNADDVSPFDSIVAVDDGCRLIDDVSKKSIGSRSNKSLLLRHRRDATPSSITISSITTLSIMTLSIRTLSITMLSIMTLSIMRLSIMTLSITTLSIIARNTVLLSVYAECLCWVSMLSV